VTYLFFLLGYVAGQAIQLRLCSEAGTCDGRSRPPLGAVYDRKSIDASKRRGSLSVRVVGAQ
jgi:hypothetical protein